LHAYEAGAGDDDAGHVWADNPALPEDAIAGAGGFLTVLGSTADGYAADVYTFPLDRDVPVEISLEAQIMENTCGGVIRGTILRNSPIGEPEAVPLAMAAPGCDAVGDYLVLKNLPQNLKIAQN
ncbi:MAG: hypothetical protein D6801_07920, partial [Alphaproteobacteria bacterium]